MAGDATAPSRETGDDSPDDARDDSPDDARDDSPDDARDDSPDDATREPRGDPLDVLVVAIDEYYYVPTFLDGILDSEDVRVRAIAAVPPTLGGEPLPAFLWRLYRAFGPRVFAMHASFQAKYRLLDSAHRLTGRWRAYSLASLARERGIAYRDVDDVNAPSFRRYAESIEPDVLLSVAAPQKFEPPLLAVPSVAALNVHSSLLPEHRGVSPSFWSLLEGDDRTGVTVHYMDEGLDTGDVVLQRPIPVRDDDTLHSLNRRVADEGAAVLAAALHRVRAGTVDPTPIDPDEGTYHSLPEREDVRRFLERGNAFY